MVKSAEEWLGAGDIDGTRQRSILTERAMRLGLVVIGRIRPQSVTRPLLSS